MTLRFAFVVIGAFLIVGLQNGTCQETSKPTLAATPPMGWNSWDGYGTTISETQFKANADWLAKHLKPFGWEYVTVDMEWFVTNPTSRRQFEEFEVPSRCLRKIHAAVKVDFLPQPMDRDSSRSPIMCIRSA